MAAEPIAKHHGYGVSTIKSITVLIDNPQLKDLKQNNYKLCFAKGVGKNDKSKKAFNVAWSVTTHYSNKTTFSWDAKYEIYGKGQFDASLRVTSETTPVPVSPGQKVVLDAYFTLNNAVFNPGDPYGMAFANEYGSISIGLKQMVVDVPAASKYMPVYMTGDNVIKGSTTFLYPSENILVWLGQDIETGDPVILPRDLSIDVDLADVSSASVQLVDGCWIRV